MTFKLKISKWGNSNAIRLPKALVEALNAGENTELEASFDRENGKVTLSKGKRPILKDMVALITPENSHSEVDWGPKVGKEVW